MRLQNLISSAVLLLLPITATAQEALVRSGETVAFLGDSITHQGAVPPGGYVCLVESGLAANGIEVKVVPAGVGGNRSTHMLARLERDVLSKKPTWMTLSCGVNDVYRIKQNNDGTSLDTYKKEIREIVERCEKAGVKVMILTATLIGPDPDDDVNVTAREYNGFLRDLAKEKDLPLADLSADMIQEQAGKKAKGSKTHLTVDGIHMNYLGNLMMAKGVLKAFGLNEAQMATAIETWESIPGLVPLNTRVSLKELRAIQAAGDATRRAPETVVSDWIKERIQSQP